MRERRQDIGAARRYRKVDTCAGEFAAATPYLYGLSTLDEVPPRRRPAVVILGSGPVRIGQGIPSTLAACRRSPA